MNNPALVSLQDALKNFVDATKHQSQEHIKPLHWHITTRLVIEGGFHPDSITPRPPLRVETMGTGTKRSYSLICDPDAAKPGEQTILGGLKTKNVDVVVSTRETGPCLAVSVKGSLNAFRNLTNRMEEAVGDCTNLHISYPALVYGFLHVIRANRETDVKHRNDIAVFDNGAIAEGLKRYHDTMARLTHRSDVRNEASRYETVALALVETQGPERGMVKDSFPAPESPLLFASFFDTLYTVYDLRFVFSAPALQSKTRRLEWSPDSPAIENAKAIELNPRISN